VSPLRDGLIDGEGDVTIFGIVTTEPPANETTAPDRALPVMTALSPNEIDPYARILPIKMLFAPIIAVVPTLQKTFCSSAPFISTMDDESPVMHVEDDLNIQTEDGLFWPFRVRTLDAFIDSAFAIEQYTPLVMVRSPRSPECIVSVHVAIETAKNAVKRSTAQLFAITEFASSVPAFNWYNPVIERPGDVPIEPELNSVVVPLNFSALPA
jgi:hypothetical protein